MRVFISTDKAAEMAGMNQFFYFILKCFADNVVVDAFKLILLNYSNFNIAKIIVKKNRKGKVTQSRLPTNTELIFNKLVLIKSIQNG